MAIWIVLAVIVVLIAAYAIYEASRAPAAAVPAPPATTTVVTNAQGTTTTTTTPPVNQVAGTPGTVTAQIAPMGQVEPSTRKERVLQILLVGALLVGAVAAGYWLRGLEPCEQKCDGGETTTVAPPPAPPAPTIVYVTPPPAPVPVAPPVPVVAPTPVPVLPDCNIYRVGCVSGLSGKVADPVACCERSLAAARGRGECR